MSAKYSSNYRRKSEFSAEMLGNGWLAIVAELKQNESTRKGSRKKIIGRRNEQLIEMSVRPPGRSRENVDVET